MLDTEKVVWLENPVRGRIKGLNFRGFETRSVSCDIECVSETEASSAVKGAVTSRSLSQVPVSATRCTKQATSSASCTDWVWPPGGAAILGKPCWILWVHRGQKTRDLTWENCPDRIFPGNLFKLINESQKPCLST